VHSKALFESLEGEGGKDIGGMRLDENIEK